jgi:uncharacterized DUF497 family protein
MNRMLVLTSVYIPMKISGLGGGAIRIISARQATRKERSYDEA